MALKFVVFAFLVDEGGIGGGDDGGVNTTGGTFVRQMTSLGGLIGIAICVSLLFAFFGFFCWRRRQKQRATSGPTPAPGMNQEEQEERLMEEDEDANVKDDLESSASNGTGLPSALSPPVAGVRVLPLPHHPSGVPPPRRPDGMPSSRRPGIPPPRRPAGMPPAKRGGIFGKSEVKSAEFTCGDLPSGTPLDFSALQRQISSKMSSMASAAAAIAGATYCVVLLREVCLWFSILTNTDVAK